MVPSKNKWKDIDIVKNELLLLIKGNDNFFPTRSVLKRKGRDSLYRASIKYHGGLEKLMESLKKDPSFLELDIKYPSLKYANWKDIDFLKGELLPICMKAGLFVTADILRKAKKGGMVTGIYSYHGGLTKLKELLKTDPDFKPFLS